MPRLTLWAWEMPEHLEFIDPHEVAVAYLDQTLFVGRRVVARPRRQPMQVPDGAQVMAVVRVEMPAGTLPTPDDETAVVAALVRSARRPGISALQVDFDALESQRGFYGRLLRRLRPEMPPGMPLSITALASWCAYDCWLNRLPVDEAVPMLFRMGKEQSLFRSADDGPLIREPLCSASLGVSTDEPWPTDVAGKRLYVFHPRPWTKESLARVVSQVNQSQVNRSQVDRLQASGDQVSRNQVTQNRVSGDQVTPDRLTRDRVTAKQVTGDRVTAERVLQ